jgi:hypothetical protein
MGTSSAIWQREQRKLPVNVNSPILGMSSGLTKKDRMPAALRWSCPEIATGAEILAELRKATSHQRRDPTFSGAALPSSITEPCATNVSSLTGPPGVQTGGRPARAARRLGVDMNGLLRVCQYSAVGGAGSMVNSSVRPLVVRVRIGRGPPVLDARRGSLA